LGQKLSAYVPMNEYITAEDVILTVVKKPQYVK